MGKKKAAKAGKKESVRARPLTKTAPEEKKILSETAPFEAKELRAVFSMPYKILDIVLSYEKRLTETIASEKNIALLVCTLLFASILFPLPFGVVLGVENFWKIAVLFLGSLAICFPSLQVFSSYVGCRININQNLALGLVITCVAGLFTFGFFPILWFLKATTEESAIITPYHITIVLLILSLAAGIGQLFRSLYRFKGLVQAYPVLMLCWQVLFIFISYRMARLLDLL